MAPASSERKLGKKKYGAVRGLSGRYDFLKFFPELNKKWRGWGFGSRLKLDLVVDCPPRERLGNSLVGHDIPHSEFPEKKVLCVLDPLFC
jgi:hypothetical protein